MDDKGIVIEYRVAEIVKGDEESEYDISHVDLPLLDSLVALTEVVKSAVKEIESVGIEYKRM